MTSPKLYFTPGSCSFAALVALEEAGAVFEAKLVRLADGEQRRPEYLAISPRGQVPALATGTEIIRENIAVLTYIARRFPAAGLLPFDNPAALAKAYEFLSWFATNLHVAIAQIWRGERFTDDASARAALATSGAASFERALSAFEDWTMQVDGPWLLGPQFSVLDPLSIVATRWADRLGIGLAPYPGVAVLTARVADRPSTIRALAREATAR